jgi:hypothetical protein
MRQLLYYTNKIVRNKNGSAILNMEKEGSGIEKDRTSKTG